MKSPYGTVLTDFYIVWGRVDRKLGRLGLGPFWTGAVLTGNHPEYGTVVFSFISFDWSLPAHT